MRGLLLPPQHLLLGKSFGFCDPFVSKDTTFWTTTATDTGAAVMTDAAGGVIQLQPSDGTVADNDEVYLQTTSEIFKIAAGKPISFASRVQFAQAATNAANIISGLADAPIANTLVDNGAGPKTSFSGAAFFCVDGGLNWNVIYSDGATQTKAELTATNTLNKTAAVAATAASVFTLLEIDIVPKTSALVDVIFKINGSTVFKMMDRTYANATEMAAFVGAKNGSANQQVLNVDDVSAWQAV
jgi:hypothetical protein